MGRKKSAAASAENNAGRLQWHPAFSSAFQGESKLGMLISRLFADGRVDDARRAADDANLRRKYYQEYGMVN